MSKISLFSGSGGVIAGAAVAMAAGVAGLVIWSQVEDGAPAPQPVAVAPQPQPQPEAEPDRAPDSTRATDTDNAIAADAPRFALVRVEPDGLMQVAGTAQPGATVSLLLDNAKVGEATVGRDGSFAAMLDVPPADAPRLMRLELVMGDTIIAGAEEVIIAPTGAPDASAPAQVADAAPEAPDTPAVPEAVPDVAQAETAQPETPEKPAVLLSDAQGVRVIQPATTRDTPPEVMSSVALDAITYSDEGEVQLAGRGPGQGFVRIYLDNTPVTTSRIAADGSWRTDLPQVDTGIYTLRVDQVTSQGNVISRVETPFKREDTAQLAATASADGPVTAITVQPGNTLWAIARDRYGEGTMYVELFRANADRIRDPDLIYPGQVFDLPMLD